MATVTIPKDIRFYHNGTKPKNYTKGEVVEDADKDLIAWVGRNGGIKAPVAPVAVTPGLVIRK